jgi:hypothetical protein
MEKATGFLVVVLVSAADVCTTVELILGTMVVPVGKLSETITLPTSSVTKLAVDELSVAKSIVVEPSEATVGIVIERPTEITKGLLKLFVANSLQPTRRRVYV